MILLETLHNNLRSGVARQAVMNGNFDVWQRGLSFSNPASTAYTADRWRYFVGADGGTLPTLITVAQQAITPGALDYSASCLEFASNGAGSGLGTGSYNLLAHYIENGTRHLCGAGKKLTLSFYAKTNSAGRKVGVYFSQGYGTGGSPTATETIVGSNFTLTTSWVRYEITIDTNTLSGKTFGSNKDDVFSVIFVNQCGSGTFAERVGSAIPYGANNLQITGVQLNTGSVALPFFPKSFEEELRMCMRYYENNFNYGTTPNASTNNEDYDWLFSRGTADTGGTDAYDRWNVKFKAKKRNASYTLKTWHGGGSTTSESAPAGRYCTYAAPNTFVNGNWGQAYKRDWGFIVLGSWAGFGYGGQRKAGILWEVDCDF